MPNEVCSSYRSPLIGGHSTASFNSLQDFSFSSDMQHVGNKDWQNLKSLLRLPASNSRSCLKLSSPQHNSHALPSNLCHFLSYLHHGWTAWINLQCSWTCLPSTWSTAHTACLPPFSPAYQPAQSQLPVIVPAFIVPCSHLHIPAFSSISFTLNMPPPFSLVFGTQ